MTISDAIHARARALVGTAVGKYTIDRVLGVGGMGAVFAVTHRNGSRSALKVLHPELSRLPDVRARFLREGYIANRVDHEGVVRVLDDDDDARGNVYLVMELLAGETLESQWERSAGGLPVTEVLDRSAQLLDVLDAAHSKRIVHRDIKPENVFITTEGRLKVLDFGIARLLDGTSATKSGELIGTPAFMAPEQAGGRTREIDHRTDLWSVGAMMFTLLTGQFVHHYDTPLLQMVHAAGTKPRSIATVAPELPSDVIEIVDRALAFDREDRWASARAMGTAVRTTRATLARSDADALGVAHTRRAAELGSSSSTATLVLGSGGAPPSPGKTRDK